MAEIRQICPELAAKARDELLEVEKRIPEDIKALRDWVLKQPHLKARTNDQFLICFLRGSKYRLEKAKEKIDNYYTIRSLSPELALIRPFDDKALRLAMIGPVVCLQKTMKIDGPRICIARYGLFDHREFNVVDIVQIHLRIMDILMNEDDNSIIGGVIVVVDCTAISLGFIQQLNISMMNIIRGIIAKGNPTRFRGAHLINTTKEMTATLNILRSLMGSKLKERFFVHSSLDNLCEHIPKEYLPIEYGGENGCLQDSVDIWVQRFTDYKDYFKEDMQYKSDEKLRVGNKNSPESLFGLDGSFRKLEVD